MSISPWWLAHLPAGFVSQHSLTFEEHPQKVSPPYIAVFQKKKMWCQPSYKEISSAVYWSWSYLSCLNGLRRKARGFWDMQTNYFCPQTQLRLIKHKREDAHSTHCNEEGKNVHRHLWHALLLPFSSPLHLSYSINPERVMGRTGAEHRIRISQQHQALLLRL